LPSCDRAGEVKITHQQLDKETHMSHHRAWFQRGLITASAAVLAACAGGPEPMSHAAMSARDTATASLAPTQGNTARGSVTFHADGDGVFVHARVSGLKPNAEHGFHVHEKGDCNSPDGNSAGGHFNPAAAPHGPQDGPHHAGDMPSLKADANGMADAKFKVVGLAVGSGAADVVGRAVIVHANPDDYRTQPTGNAGARLACGVVVRQR
jgi:superoxide dismutase, Cu-Zn family